VPAGKSAEDVDADDASAISILLGTVDSVQFHHIGDLESARAMWATLMRIHNAPSRHKLASLLRQFYRFDAGTKTIDEAASFLNATQVDIRNIRPEDTPSDYTKAIILMESLGEPYRVVNTMLSADENLTYDGCVARLKEEEASQQKVAVAMAVSPGMRKSSGSKSAGPPTDRYPCSHCGQKGHWRAQCPQRNGGHPGKGKGSKNGQNRSDGGNRNSKQRNGSNDRKEAGGTTNPGS
jgi:hypothetical protein